MRVGRRHIRNFDVIDRGRDLFVCFGGGLVGRGGVGGRSDTCNAVTNKTWSSLGGVVASSSSSYG